jgi:hypothetical protein
MHPAETGTATHDANKRVVRDGDMTLPDEGSMTRLTRWGAIGLSNRRRETAPAERSER